MYCYKIQEEFPSSQKGEQIMISNVERSVLDLSTSVRGMEEAEKE